MRAWSIEIHQLNENGEEVPATLFDRVTYKLHPSFKNDTQGTFAQIHGTKPTATHGMLAKTVMLTGRIRIVFKKPPFRIQEEGWGEFDMEIILTATEKGGDHSIKHDLNFLQDRYEAKHTIVSVRCCAFMPLKLKYTNNVIS
jgi:transcription initiation factor IIF auxiliary subunit